MFPQYSLVGYKVRPNIPVIIRLYTMCKTLGKQHTIVEVF